MAIVSLEFKVSDIGIKDADRILVTKKPAFAKVKPQVVKYKVKYK